MCGGKRGGKLLLFTSNFLSICFVLLFSLILFFIKSKICYFLISWASFFFFFNFFK
ncbi:unnamed protein product [Meloidogyne enterolobii]|uniref:Uncharacterized protein n=1 Tax=Meloidogyne enterolobii TaxID=390850 RepID=A0ACB1AFM9_MELEN